MSTFELNLVLLAVTALVVFGFSFLVRRLLTSLDEVDPAPWASTLSYVATAYGVVVGFSILFLFGTFSDARQAVGDEATSIGTAFEEAALFRGAGPGIQSTLICYSRAVPEHDWPAMRRDRIGAPEVDAAFADLVAALGAYDEPTTGALNSAAATNLVVQIGNVSTARETRLVAAENSIPTMLWILLIGGGLFVVTLIFVVTLPARAITQAAPVASSAVFTVVMLLLVVALSTPFAEGTGRVSPRLIEQTTESMAQTSPTLAAEACEAPPGG